MTKCEQCKTCTFWKNNQRDLNYSDSRGVCLHPSNNFTTTDGRDIGVLDMQNMRNRKDLPGNPSHDFEAVESNIVIGKILHSRYLLVVDEDFGCIRHNVKDHLHKED